MPEVYANLSMLWLENGRVKGAGTRIEDGITKYHDPASLFSLCPLTQPRSRKLNGAIKWMRKSIDAEPADLSHYYNLARMYALDDQDALRFLALNAAIERGYRNLSKISSDRVFQELRQQTEFQKIKSRLE